MPLTAVDGASAAATQQHLAALLADDGPVASAAHAAEPLYRNGLAVALASHIGRAVYTQRFYLEMLPPLTLATRAVRMLRGGDGSGDGGQCSCLRTDCGLQTLRTEVMCLYKHSHVHEFAWSGACQRDLAGKVAAAVPACNLHHSQHGVRSSIVILNVTQATAAARIMCQLQKLAGNRFPQDGVLPQDGRPCPGVFY